MCDLLWADPMETFIGEVESPFEFNAVRGCSYNFSYNIVCEFLDKNGLLSVIRAHEAQDAGYKMHRRNDRTGFPSLITLFSAPNYLDTYNNKGALMRYENNVINIRQFNASTHPYNLPGFMNVFNWSIPFVAEKVGELLIVILNLVDDVQADQEEIMKRKVNAERERKREALRSKVRTVSRMLTLYKTMRREREIRNSNNPLLSVVPASPDKPQDEVKNNINEARPPGVQEVIQAAKIEPSTPDGIRRRLSRDKILSQKKQQEFRQKFGGTKIYDAKDFMMSDSPPKEMDPTYSTPRSSSPIARHIKFTTSMSEIPTMGSDPMMPSPTVITTTSEGKADVAAVESGTEHSIQPSSKQINK